MKYKKILLVIFTILCTVGVIAQQIYWTLIGNYTSAALSWVLIELGLIYLITKAINKD